MVDLVSNQKALFDYEILEKFEAGLVLTGDEVKSLKKGLASLKGAYVVLNQIKGKVVPQLINAKIAIYPQAYNKQAINPYRNRKLLLTKKEIKSLLGKINEKGLTMVPIRFYIKSGLIKLEFALARGKKKFDKREIIKKRELQRVIRRTLKNFYK